MKFHLHGSEKGQAIVYLVLAFIVFLGFVALAIDGGMALANRRHAQNAADAASLAGAGQAALSLSNAHVKSSDWVCGSGALNAAEAVAITSAENRAADNNFTITNSTGDNGVYVVCHAGGIPNDYMDVTVNISQTTQSSFAQVLFPNALQNRVTATTRIKPQQPYAFGNAIVALNPTNCVGQQNGSLFYGSGDSTVNGGGVFTNGCLSGKGSSGAYIEPPDQFSYYGEWIPGNVNWDPSPAIPSPQQITEEYYAVTFDPSTACTGRWVTNTDIPRNGKPLPYGEGVYCFHGDFTTQAKDVIKAEHVTFYIEGGITFNGNSNDVITAASSNVNGAIPGVVVYVPHIGNNACPDQVVKFNGTSGLTFTGIILAPCADVTMNGDTGVVTWENQIIGWNVHIGGNATTEINFDEDKMAYLPTKIALYR